MRNTLIYLCIVSLWLLSPALVFGGVQDDEAFYLKSSKCQFLGSSSGLVKEGHELNVSEGDNYYAKCSRSVDEQRQAMCRFDYGSEKKNIAFNILQADPILYLSAKDGADTIIINKSELSFSALTKVIIPLEDRNIGLNAKVCHGFYISEQDFLKEKRRESKKRNK